MNYEVTQSFCSSTSKEQILKVKDMVLDNNFSKNTAPLDRHDLSLKDDYVHLVMQRFLVLRRLHRLINSTGMLCIWKETVDASVLFAAVQRSNRPAKD